ncbi:Hypothetical predicted protein [Paramuricea clavata]|uniref:Uncharacterized protein n=1 Tax=Paramuricea clavata TaxID=317549 RepID=A0A7D9JH51_PARCT|nr:Hypothetical predicted protein [Paramuricea clavata]
MITNSYAGATPQIRTPTGLTADIHILSGVMQGCPLNPIIFNPTIDLILRAIKRSASDICPAKLHGISFFVLACADRCLVVKSIKKDRLHAEAFERCFVYRYRPWLIGVPIGLIYDHDNILDLVHDLTRDFESIEKSLLAPWQKLDMIRTFLRPSLTFALRAGFPQKDNFLVYRSHLVATVRKICALPSRASVAYIFAHKRVDVSVSWMQPLKLMSKL